MLRYQARQSTKPCKGHHRLGSPPTPNMLTVLHQHLESGGRWECCGAINWPTRRTCAYDKRTHCKPFEEDLVWLHAPAVPQGQLKKFHSPWTRSFHDVQKNLRHGLLHSECKGTSSMFSCVLWPSEVVPSRHALSRVISPLPRPADSTRYWPRYPLITFYNIIQPLHFVTYSGSIQPLITIGQVCQWPRLGHLSFGVGDSVTVHD